MNTLVVNCGSSSLKIRLFDDEHAVLANGIAEPLGRADTELRCQAGSQQTAQRLEDATHEGAFEALCKALLELSAGSADIGAVGHRVVHGGERFRKAVLIDERIEREIEALAPLAPLHNPLCLQGIRAARKHFPDASHVAVFDTAFHQTLPEEAFLYALPYEFYTRDRIRRYGFHGSSHRSVSERAIELLGPESHRSRIITCHLGAGCSTAAVRDGRSVDTSMGMTPLEGLVMATRSGDLDPGIPAFLQEQGDRSAREVEDLLQHKSGLLGISGLSGDIRELTREAEAGHARAELALRVFAHRVRKYIGAHLTVLGGADAIVFTGGAGENSPSLRNRISSGLEELGIEIDPRANETGAGSDRMISTEGSRVAIFVIASNEELAIARDTQDVVRNSRSEEQRS
ncbi:MAG: acetate kinase [bacterium]|nr:acetate kinase [bacterium]